MQKKEFPKKKDNPRNVMVHIAVTERQKQAFRKEAKATNKSISEVGYEMLMGCGLAALESRHFASDATNLTQ
jgi:hypothetical protein